jgi:hypothetical protein
MRVHIILLIAACAFAWDLSSALKSHRHHRKRVRKQETTAQQKGMKLTSLGSAAVGKEHHHVDKEGGPQLFELVSRINANLEPFFKVKDKSKINKCFKGWKPGEPDAFLPGCPSDAAGCKGFASGKLEAAKAWCVELGAGCGGVIEFGAGGRSEVRAGNDPQPSPNKEISHTKLPCTKATNAKNVFAAFHSAIDAALVDPSLNLDNNDALFPKLYYGLGGNTRPDPADMNFGQDQKDTMFLSVASYRDENCGPTVQRAFANAKNPLLLTVGVVEQNCHADCMIGTGWASTRRIVPAPPDVDCVTEFCASEEGHAHCLEGRVKLLRLNESESYGPFFARFIASKLWGGQEFVVQVDSHTEFKQDWDESLKTQLRLTPSFPNSVISNYPPSHGVPWRSGQQHTPEALCDIQFADGIMRLEHTSRRFKQQHDVHSEVPKHSLYIAAGFFATHATYLRDVPYDPYLPYIFMGEELIMSVRAWTAGFDIYGPTEDVCKHMYVRQESSKFW